MTLSAPGPSDLTKAVATPAPMSGDESATPHMEETVMIRSFAVVSLALSALACSAAPASSTSSSSTSGGASNAPAARAEASDGSIGSSCGTCQQGLTCGNAPGGYCTKACSGEADCGSGAHCIGIDQQTFVCLKTCASDGDCRSGYSCLGDAQYKFCAPGQSTDPNGGGASSSGGGSSSGGAGANCIDLVGSWTTGCTSGGQCESITFNADGTVMYELWNAVAGNTQSTGTFALSCPSLTVDLTNGYWAPKTMQFQVVEGGYFVDPKYPNNPYKKCNGSCM